MDIQPFSDQTVQLLPFDISITDSRSFSPSAYIAAWPAPPLDNSYKVVEGPLNSNHG